VKLLLDENFPLALERRMLQEGFEVSHIITLGLRGSPDNELIARLRVEPDLILLTQDTEFLAAPGEVVGKIIVSRIGQERPLQRAIGDLDAGPRRIPGRAAT
jgi:predicted nuclease of predicted toxin-antitoxin system